ncbi:MAG: dynamin family protein [Fretibacterium sp.]|nr:dynamin family protein [Fretibacterium sp.]
MSRALLAELRLSSGARPRTLDQWRELCHPGDHRQMQAMDRALSDAEQGSFVLARRLYCGDGVYRTFRLDACVQRDGEGRPSYLMGVETLMEEGQAGEAGQDWRRRMLDATTHLRDERDRLEALLHGEAAQAPKKAPNEAPSEAPSLSAQESAQEEENLTLRRALQRQAVHLLARPPFAAHEGPERAVGVLGLTGSGKSALVNALMGERLLPEGVSATTNLAVFCRRGERAASILYQDGGTEWALGADLTPRWMADRTSEQGNPANERGILRVEWSSPGAAFPEGLVLVDTPCLDAWGLSQDNAPAVCALLSQLDAVLYAVPLRSRLKAADRALLSAIVREGRPLVALLTLADLERDEVEAGRVIRSRRQRLEGALRELREDLERVSALPRALIPVSSRLALRGFYDRASEEWRASNFDALLRQLAASGGSPPPQGTAPEAGAPASSDGAERADEAEEGPPQAGLFDSLLLSMREQSLRGRFLALPALQGGAGRLVLLGPRRQDGLRLLSRLAHDASLSDAGAEDGDWLLFGREEPPFPCVRLPEALGGLDVLVAPSDAFLPPSGLDWEALFGHWAPAVHLDLARVGSGLSDLARAPYLPALAAVPRRVLAFAHGGLFDTRLPSLYEAAERVEGFARLRGFQGRTSLFVHENYDPRYTDFLELGARVRPGSTAADLASLAASLAARWEQGEQNPAPPFTREAMALALLGLRARLRGSGPPPCPEGQP